MPYKKGESGNPAGRRKGIKNPELTSIKNQSKVIIDRVIAQAEEGCVASQKMVLDRIVPSLKAVDQPIILSGYPRKGSLVDKADFFISAMATGKISISQGTSFVQCISSFCTIKENTEFEERLNELEAVVNNES